MTRTDPSAKRQQHIAQSLLDLMKKQPYIKIPISMICRSSGISRNVFYRYFESKEDIILYLADSLLDDFDRFRPLLLLLNWHEQNYNPAPLKMAENSLHLFVEPLFRPQTR